MPFEMESKGKCMAKNNNNKTPTIYRNKPIYTQYKARCLLKASKRVYVCVTL